MKLPIKIIIAGREYTVKRDKKVGVGGWFWSKKRQIGIGKHEDKEREMRWLLHEILEVVMFERYARYTIHGGDSDNGSYLFSFDHKEFCNIVDDLFLALKPFLK